jgi:hypothetical protein
LPFVAFATGKTVSALARNPLFDSLFFLHRNQKEK